MENKRDGCTVRHIGLDIDFHHPESKQLRLSPQIEDGYGIDKETAQIFTENASGLNFSSEEMLDWYLSRSGKTLTDHLSDAATDDAETRRMAITFPIQFPENMFHMMTDRGAVDIKTLRLAIEITVQK